MNAGKATFATAAAAVVFVNAGTRAGDWAQFRGPNGDGISPETGINKNWTKRPAKSDGPSAASVKGG